MHGPDKKKRAPRGPREPGALRPGPKPGSKHAAKAALAPLAAEAAQVPRAIAEIREKLTTSTTVLPGRHAEFERRWLSRLMVRAQLTRLVVSGTASAADRAELRRTEAELAQMDREVTGADQRQAAALKPLPVTDRATFCLDYLTVADGSPFSLVGREWQKRHLWDPLDGYKLWPVDRDLLCPACAARSGEIVPTIYAADATRATEHAAAGCKGLYAHIVWLVLLQLKRQQGKTTAVAGYAIPQILCHTHEAVAYLAGSEDQAESLFKKNFAGSVTRSADLAARFTLRRTALVSKETGSTLEVFPCSLAGTTGGALTLVVVDEARDVPHDIFAAYVPQIYARNGWRCPTGGDGHSWSIGDLGLFEDREGAAVDPGQPQYGAPCTVCGARLEPWAGRAVAMSSAQELDGGAADWFHDLCVEIERAPAPDAHCFRTAEVINPKVARQIVSRSESLLGRVQGLGEAMAIEAGGVSRRKGDPFLTEPQLAAVEDRRLKNAEGGARPAVAFLDTSETQELTSLVICEDDSAPEERPWHRLVEVRIDVWEPAKLAGHVINEKEIEDHLYLIVPQFALVALRIDDRLRPWAKALVTRLKREAPFRGIVRGCSTGADSWQRHDRRVAWEKLDERILGRTIRLIYHTRQRAELRGARRFNADDGGVDIREARRRVRHLDIAEGLASCCLMVHELAQKPRRQSLADVEAGGGGAAGSRLQRLRKGGGMQSQRGKFWS